MSLEIALLSLTCVVNLSLGLFIVLRNPKLLSGRAFFALTVCISVWATSNYLTESRNLPLSSNAIFNKLAFVFALWCLISVTVFCYSFPYTAKVSKPIRVAFFSLMSVLSVLSTTTLVAGKVTKKATGELAFSVGQLLPVYALFLLLLLFFGAKRLLSVKNNNTAEVRSQIDLIVIGFCSSAGLGLLLNAVLPNISDNFQTAKYGPLLTLILVSTTSYAIVKHRLFDIRLVVARSLGYALSIITFASIFIAGSFALTSIFLKTDSSTTATTKLIYTVLALVLAFILAPLRSFFNKYTEKYFYRDAYDSQAFLGTFNKTLVSTYDLVALLKKSAQIIEDNIKPTHTVFGLRETQNTKQRIVGTGNHPKFKESDINLVSSLTPKIKQKVIVTDQLEQKHASLKSLLQSNDIAVLARLTSNINEEGIGYLILGSKKSGNLYSQQDLNNIEILADELVIAIQNALSFEEIQNFNITLQEKVNDATRKLRRTNEKLKQMDETKDDFISMASHQLRTPLTSVKGYISMVLEEDAGKITSTQRDMLGQAFFSSQRMVYLIADLLNVSRLKTGKFIMEPIKLNLATMIEQEMQQLEESAAARNLSLRYDKPTNFPDTLLDETKTRQVIMNFIDNAIYYTKSGGRIRVSLTETASTIEMRVEDDGIGVPKSEIPHLFTKFYRAGNARQARPDGTGLGLYMAKKVIVGQGGSVIFESVEGKGSVFGFVFSKSAVGVNLGVPQHMPVKKPELALK